MNRFRSIRLILVSILSFGSIFLFTLPASAMVSVIGELTHEYTVSSGSERQGEITLKNKGDEEVVVKLYLRDYLFNADGKTQYLNPGMLNRSNSSWIALERSRVTIKPNQSVTVQYTLNVPVDSTLNGTYWSIIMAEPAIPEAAPGPSTDKVQVGIRETIRFGIQVVTTIGNTGKKEIKFKGARMVSDERGDLTLLADLGNIGERWLRPDVWVELYREDGSLVGKFKGINMRIFPGTSIRQNLKLGYLKKGKYMALVVADDGEEYVVGAQYTLNVGKS